MLKANDKRGLSLGAIFALVASLFIATPAAQASETTVMVYPAVGETTQTTILHGEGYDLRARFGTGVASRLTSPTTNEVAGFGFKITKPDSVTVSYQTSTTTTSPRFLSFSPYATQNTFGMESSKSSETLTLKVVGGTSVSASVNITVTPFIDLDKDGVQDAGETEGTPITITFAPWSVLGAAMTFNAPPQSNVGITASVTLTQGTVNWAMLDGLFTVGLSGTNEGTITGGQTHSAIADGAAEVYQLTGAELAAKGYSFSARATTELSTTIAGATVLPSYSAVLYYSAVTLGSANPTGGAKAKVSEQLLATVSVAVEAKSFVAMTLSPVTSSTIKKVGDNTAEARTNQSFTLNAYGYSDSSTTSVALAKILTVSSLTSIDMDADSGVIIGGVTYTSSTALLSATISIAAAASSVVVSTFGQDGGATDAIAFTLRSTAQALSVNLTVNLDVPAYTLEDVTPGTFASTTGVSKAFSVGIEDQWGAMSTRTDQRVSAKVALGGSTSDAVSAAPVAGVATVTVTPVPSTRTGSATVTFTLQTYNQDSGLWVDGDTATATWNVYSYAAGSDAFTSRTATASASVSYGVAAYSWSGVVSVAVANTFSNVTVTATGLVIEDNNDATVTASNTLTVAASGKTAAFRFASKKAGTYTVTFTNGAASTTSVITISGAGSDRGASFTFDTSAIDAGKTKQIVGTLLDANGNPVDTTLPGTTAGDSGTASILVTVAGTAGIVVGTLPTETDANGQFRVSVLTAASDTGTLVITATYYRGSTATATVTSTQNVAVAPAAAPEVNAVIGSFNGRWAVRVENAKGSVVSVKAGSRWVKFTSLNNNYLFSRKSVVGRTLAVSVWVDGELQNSQTITIK
jgi:hypothetical protein